MAASHVISSHYDKIHWFGGIRGDKVFNKIRVKSCGSSKTKTMSWKWSVTFVRAKYWSHASIGWLESDVLDTLHNSWLIHSRVASDTLLKPYSLRLNTVTQMNTLMPVLFSSTASFSIPTSSLCSIVSCRFNWDLWPCRCLLVWRRISRILIIFHSNSTFLLNFWLFFT